MREIIIDKLPYLLNKTANYSAFLGNIIENPITRSALFAGGVSLATGLVREITRVSESIHLGTLPRAAITFGLIGGIATAEQALSIELGNYVLGNNFANCLTALTCSSVGYALGSITPHFPMYVGKLNLKERLSLLSQAMTDK